MRTTSYDPKYCELLLKHMAEGKSFGAFGHIAKCGRTTLYAWLDQQKDFAEAKAQGETASLYYWESIGHGGITGQLEKFAAAPWIYTMKCRFRKFGYDEGGKRTDDEDEVTDLSSIPTDKLLKLVKMPK